MLLAARVSTRLKDIADSAEIIGAHARARTHTHVNTHTHTDTRMNTHTHTHTLKQDHTLH